MKRGDIEKKREKDVNRSILFEIQAEILHVTLNVLHTVLKL